MSDTGKGQNEQKRDQRVVVNGSAHIDFVLEKNIFSNIFEKDIRRVFIYKKAERLAKAIHLISPAFVTTPTLRDRTHTIAIALIDAATLPPLGAREQLSRELLALSSVLAIARSGGLLSEMNAELISREARLLLSEVASYEEPRLFLDDSPTLAALAKQLPAELYVAHARPEPVREARPARAVVPAGTPAVPKGHKGQIKDTARSSDRREAILSVLRDKRSAYIKDISTVVRGVSEKTIQRELQALLKEGAISKQGERRWTLYRIV